MPFVIIKSRLDINRRLNKEWSIPQAQNRYIKNSSLTNGMVSCVAAMGKRDRLEIIAAILDLCSKPRSKTRIMYGTNLSWKMLQQYLSHMQSLGLLEAKEDSTKYVTTGRGQDFLEKWKELQELM